MALKYDDMVTLLINLYFKDKLFVVIFFISGKKRSLTHLYPLAELI